MGIWRPLPFRSPRQESLALRAALPGGLNSRRAKPSLRAGEPPIWGALPTRSTLVGEPDERLHLVENPGALAGLVAGHELPGLQLRMRARLLDQDLVAGLRGVRLVMGVVVLRAPHRLLHDGVREATLDLDHHGLVLLVADDDALQYAFRHPRSPKPSLRRRASAASACARGRCPCGPRARARCFRAVRWRAGSAG